MPRKVKQARDTDDVSLVNPSPFFRLPLEVRIMIYKLVMHDDLDVGARMGDGLWSVRPCETGYPISIKTQSRTRSGAIMRPAQDLRNLWNSTPRLAIAFTCRQIHLEATPVWYSNVRFRFWDLKNMQNFFLAIGPRSCDAIRYINVYLRNRTRLKEQDHLDLSKILLTAYKVLGNVRGIVIDIGKAKRRTKHIWKEWRLAATTLVERQGDKVEHVMVLGQMYIRHKNSFDFPLIYTRESMEARLDKVTGKSVVICQGVFMETGKPLNVDLEGYELM